ncbi:hypothetical protein PROFUN_01870 [Planoprotostelium fungivorum]|uniref:BRCT domain-containing protein n=1 Tax=Planoprotostelium fungivorum TaxID=1890364 RepID=A0A2P6NYX3_9EUKA|nr:hypothetical protein PROFUN_01870 [Planoprotostelium fungivorum]
MKKDGKGSITHLLIDSSSNGTRILKKGAVVPIEVKKNKIEICHGDQIHLVWLPCGTVEIGFTFVEKIRALVAIKSSQTSNKNVNILKSKPVVKSEKKLVTVKSEEKPPVKIFGQRKKVKTEEPTTSKKLHDVVVPMPTHSPQLTTGDVCPSHEESVIKEEIEQAMSEAFDIFLGGSSQKEEEVKVKEEPVDPVEDVPVFVKPPVKSSTLLVPIAENSRKTGGEIKKRSMSSEESPLKRQKTEEDFNVLCTSPIYNEPHVHANPLDDRGRRIGIQQRPTTPPPLKSSTSSLNQSNTSEDRALKSSDGLNASSNPLTSSHSSEKMNNWTAVCDGRMSRNENIYYDLLREVPQQKQKPLEGIRFSFLGYAEILSNHDKMKMIETWVEMGAEYVNEHLTSHNVDLVVVNRNYLMGPAAVESADFLEMMLNPKMIFLENSTYIYRCSVQKRRLPFGDSEIFPYRSGGTIIIDETMIFEEDLLHRVFSFVDREKKPDLFRNNWTWKVHITREFYEMNTRHLSHYNERIRKSAEKLSGWMNEVSGLKISDQLAHRGLFDTSQCLSVQRLMDQRYFYAKSMRNFVLLTKDEKAKREAKKQQLLAVDMDGLRIFFDTRYASAY